MLLSANYSTEWVPPRYIRRLCFLLVVLITSIDVGHYGTNMSILFSIPLLLMAQLRNRWTLIGSVTVMIVLIFADYYLKRLLHRNQVVHNSVANRLLSAAALIGMTIVLYYWIHIAEHVQMGARQLYLRHSDEPNEFDEISTSLSSFVALVLCLILSATIMITDLRTPQQVNLPILYAVPLVTAAWVRSPKFLWLVAPSLMACNWIGLKFGMPPSKDYLNPTSMHRILHNRELSAAALFVLAGIMTLWMHGDTRQKTRSPGLHFARRASTMGEQPGSRPPAKSAANS